MGNSGQMAGNTEGIHSIRYSHCPETELFSLFQATNLPLFRAATNFGSS
jgi:hypothetical protein